MENQMKKLRLLKFKQAGTYQNERLILRAEVDLELGNFIFARSAREDSDKTPAISADIADVIWLPDEKVKAGDFVLVYTCVGSVRTFQNKNGTMSHVVYLNKKKAIWTNGEQSAVLFELAGWDFITVKDDELEEEEESG
jgi:hypothetical protein